MSTQKLRGTTRTHEYLAAQNEDDAADLIKELGNKRRKILRIETAMNDEIADVKHRFENEAAPIKDEVEQLIASIQSWAEVNREDLTDGNKTKTVKLATGEINWRSRPPKVSLRGKSKIIQALKNLGLQRFIRTSEDIDKEALLKEKDAAAQISGISISSVGEDFSISPYELEIEDKQ
ncbi:hypothetical protein AB835_04780 [Candidatus Endobugula sertula]|uniref:Host-nuclease inhibitor protein Gam n=1 Tax=Candidatus Endobugula sertula TaxID=62101 RepID=A0A1D2QRG5_9GAMM|nr:hypothetical protein AB835_04780 [Candidatus Endobugula sertula]